MTPSPLPFLFKQTEMTYITLTKFAEQSTSFLFYFFLKKVGQENNEQMYKTVFISYFQSFKAYFSRP